MKRRCSIRECGKAHFCDGYCKGHWFGIHHSQVGLIKRGRNWAHVTRRQLEKATA